MYRLGQTWARNTARNAFLAWKDRSQIASAALALAGGNPLPAIGYAGKRALRLPEYRETRQRISTDIVPYSARGRFTPNRRYATRYYPALMFCVC